MVNFILFNVFVVLFAYFSSGSFFITKCYLGAFSTSAAVLEKKACFLSDLQLATNVGDHSWRSRLLHKNKSSLKKLKVSLFWLSCLKNANALVASSLLVLLAKQNKRFFSPVKQRLQKTASKALLKSNTEGPSPEDTILKWVAACVVHHTTFNYTSLTEQFLLFLPFVSKNQKAFYASFLRLSGPDTSTFFEIMLFIYRQGLQKEQKQQLNNLLKIFHKAVFDKIKTYQNLPSNDLNLIIKAHISMLLSTKMHALSQFESYQFDSSCFIFIKRLLQLDKIAVINCLISLVKLIRVKKSNAQSFKTLILLVCEVFKPQNPFFLVEHFIFALKKAIVLFRLKYMLDDAKITFILSLLKSDFSFERIVGSYYLRVCQLFFWIAFLALVFFFGSTQPAHALTTGPSRVSLVGLSLSQSLVYGFLIFNKTKKKTKVRCSTGNTAYLGSSEKSQFLLKEVSKEVRFNEWLIFNHVELFDSTEAEPLFALFFKNRALTIKIKNNSKGLKEVRSAFKRRKQLIAVLKASEGQQLLQQVHARLVLKKGLLQSFYKKQKPTSQNFMRICINFINTLGSNSKGRLSICGTIYPHEYKTDVKNLFDAFYMALKTTGKKNKKSKSSNGEETPYTGSDNFELLGALSSEEEGISPSESQEEGISPSESQEEGTSPSAVTKAASLSKAEQEALLQLITKHDFVELLAFNVKDNQRFSETYSLQSAHLFPNRFYLSLNYQQNTFLCIFLPQALNGVVDRKVFGPTFWYTRMDLDKYRSRFLIYTKDILPLKNSYCSALDYVLNETLVMQKNEHGQMLGAPVKGFDNFFEFQKSFVMESYKDAGSYYCGHAPANIKKLIKPFPSQIESETGVSERDVSIQQRLLHSTALDQLEEACIQSLNGLLAQGFKIFEISEPLNVLLTSFNSSKQSQKNLDHFFETNQAFQNITNLIEFRVENVLTATNTAFLGSIWYYYQKTLSTETKLKLQKFNNWDDFIKPDKPGYLPLITVFGRSSSTDNLFDYVSGLHKRYVSILVNIGEQINTNTIFRQSAFQDYQLVLKTKTTGQIVLNQQEKDQLMLLRKAFALYLLRKLKALCLELVSLQNQNDIFLSFYQLSRKIESLAENGVQELSLQELNKLLAEAQLDFAFDDYRLSRNLPKLVGLDNVFVPISEDGLDYHVLLTNFSQFRELFKQDHLPHYFAPEGTGNFFTVRGPASEKLVGSVEKQSLVLPVGLI